MIPRFAYKIRKKIIMSSKRIILKRINSRTAKPQKKVRSKLQKKDQFGSLDLYETREVLQEDYQRCIEIGAVTTHISYGTACFGTHIRIFIS